MPRQMPPERAYTDAASWLTCLLFAGSLVTALLAGCRDRAPQRAEPTGASAVLVGTVTLVSAVPDPARVPYKDCVTFITYRIEAGESGSVPSGDKLLAVFWGMRDRKLQPAARFALGQRHRLTVRPFSDLPELARVMQADDTEEYELTPYWVVRHDSL